MFYSQCSIGYVLRIEIGEEIQEAIRQFSQAVKLKSAFYQGIGALTQVELAFFCTDTKVYERRFFDQEYEMVSFLGNLSLCNGSFTPHSHVSISDRDFHTYSGHLVRGVVSVTAEILLTALDLSLTRKEDPILKYKGLVSPNRVHLPIDM